MSTSSTLKGVLGRLGATCGLTSLNSPKNSCYLITDKHQSWAYNSEIQTIGQNPVHWEERASSSATKHQQKRKRTILTCPYAQRARRAARAVVSLTAHAALGSSRRQRHNPHLSIRSQHFH